MEELTIKGALLSTIDFTIPNSRVVKALIDAGLDGDAIYAKTYEKDIDVCAANLLLSLITVKKITEGGYTIEFPDASTLSASAWFLFGKWGIVDPEIEAAKPTVSAVKGMW
ncbi:DUF6706 family protein [Pedobacter antarcticus]|uniref:DUF6706 family protein n=1 Tax=Pedobacter antarcticus TaxID=34086 RepID=UPI002931214B|nr:DUF6706 family protein [Pedobacter antarcticus]